MPFVKKYADGSSFDYTHGYRTAAEIERLKASGEYKESEPDVAGIRNIVKAVLVLLTTLLVGALVFIPAMFALWTAENDKALVDGLNNFPGVTVIDGSHNNGEILLRATQEGEEQLLKCETASFVEEDSAQIGVFCSPGAPAVAVIPVPHKI